ncbi:YcxB family protein [Arsukibacterium indicum]|uniref:YcxB family protein n=1 Tax=Arsukibacterium indicum TaxID=2848612 RepID=A0ABS6MLY1_9GAMM|nr:YcxB family protein [Arsukibacterium indicum]MBV2129311.1 YcxB family protein [Arsukibacterium indicum]
MNFKVVTSKADYDAFYAYTASKVLKSYTWLPMLKNLLLWLVLAFSFMTFFQFQSGEIEKNFFVSILTVSIPFFAYVALSKLMEVKAAQCFTPNENGIMIGNKEFEVSADGIKEIHRYGHSFYNWDVVERVEEVNGSIYIFVDKVLALIFNSESLKSDELKEELLNTLKKYV